LKGSVHHTPSVWKAWIPAIIWLGIIAIESTASLSSENTGRILYPFLHFLFGLDPVQFLTWHFLIRKTGHVIGYAVLSILLFRAWRASVAVKNNPRWSIVWGRIALAMTALVASLDEWHQSFLPSRTGTIHDVVLDTAAGLAAQILLFLWLRGEKSDRPEAPGSPVPRTSEEPGRRSSPVTE
jgi:VanZ family protein